MPEQAGPPEQSAAPQCLYLPFVSGQYDVSTLGLSYLQVNTAQPENRLIQIDQHYRAYRRNKERCRQENLGKYYLTHNLNPDTQRQVNQTLLQHLCQAYPQWFQFENGCLFCHLSGERLRISPERALLPHPMYLDLFDALAAQIQEDLAIWQLQGDSDYLAALHVCAPNAWAPAEKIGKNFDAVHQPVPGMEAQRSNYFNMFKGLIQKQAYLRFIWDLKTCDRLNLHPEAPAVSQTESWAIPPFDPDAPELYVRVERQLLYGLPTCQALLFVIRTYLYPVKSLPLQGLQGIQKALQTMSPALLIYKHLAESKEGIHTWLSALIAHKSAASGSEPG